MPLGTTRLALEPLAPGHASEMVTVLAPPELYAVTGGEPPTAQELRARYERQSRGRSPTGDAGWLNWVLRTRADARAVGTVQATVTRRDPGLVADLAWLVTPSAQRRGLAVEATGAVLEWLHGQEVRVVRAMIAPGHEASARVARQLGLSPTPAVVDGEVVWERRSDDATRPGVTR